MGQLCEGLHSADRKLPHQAISQTNFKFIDPYKAESLISICVYLVEVSMKIQLTIMYVCLFMAELQLILILKHLDRDVQYW